MQVCPQSFLDLMEKNDNGDGCSGSLACLKIYGGAHVVNKVDEKLQSVLFRRANFGLRIIGKLLVTNT